MSTVVWDNLAERYFENGVDRGVLYLADGAVPWNGLVSVEEDFGDESTSPFFLDGVKFLDVPLTGDYKSTIQAFTFPDQFLDYEGVEDVGGGLYVDMQAAKPFGLCYRTKVNSGSGEEDYKLHICYNLTAVQDTASYESQSDSASLVTFSWKVAGVPVEAPGFRPTSHVILDSRYVYPVLLQEIEDILYGTIDTDPQIPTLSDLLDMVFNWHLLDIVDHGDGSFTITGPSSLIFPTADPTIYTIQGADIQYQDANTYTLTDTYEIH